MHALRSLAKQIAESFAGNTLVTAAALRRLWGARLVLSYHNIVEQDEPPTHGDRSLHLPLSRFRAQLDAIADLGLEVVSLDTPQGEDARPCVVITFDDAYEGALEVGLPELESRGLPCTLFVAPGLLGSVAPWWDRLASPDSGAVPHTIRSTALDALSGEDTRIMEAAAANRWLLHPPLPLHRIASETALKRAVARHARLQVGAHSWSHPNLARLDDGALWHELTAPRDWLRARFGAQYVDWLAYPYGLATGASFAAAKAAGYTGALMVSGGWDRRVSSPHACPRLNVTPGISDAGFRARLGGWR